MLSLGMVKIKDMENCHSVSINLIVKQKSKCVSDFFISTCLLWFSVWLTWQEGEGRDEKGTVFSGGP